MDETAAPDRARRSRARGGGPTRGRELRARGKRTLEKILDAGTGVFADRGFHAARVDDIVNAAQVSHGTFYLYFSSKEDLFHAIAESLAAEMVELSRELPPLTEGDEQAFRAWLDRFHALYARNGKFLRTWTEAEIVDSDLGRIARELVTEFSRQLAMRVRAEAPDLDAGIAAFALVSMIERTSYYVEARELRVSAADALDVLAAVTQAAVHGAREPVA